MKSNSRINRDMFQLTMQVFVKFNWKYLFRIHVR